MYPDILVLMTRFLNSPLEKIHCLRFTLLGKKKKKEGKT